LRVLLANLLFALLTVAQVMSASISPTDRGEERRQIAFTFDDAPLGDGEFFTGLERTKALISGLKKGGVDQVAFFVTIKNIINQESKNRLNAYVEAGHLLANHSKSHLWLRKTKPRKYLSDIDQATKVLSGYGQTRPWFRFPYLDEGDTIDRRDAVRDGLAVRGLENGYVTVDNYDWYLDRLSREAKANSRCFSMDGLRSLYVETIIEAAEFYDDIARTHLGRSPAHVLLLHENDLAALFVEDLAAAFRAAGWVIISPDNAYRDEIAKHDPDTLFNGQGRIAALAETQGVARQYLVQEREDETILDQLFEQRVLNTCADNANE